MSEIGSKVGVSENDLRNYLETTLPKEKLEKIVRQDGNISSPQTPLPIFKTWLRKNVVILIFLAVLVFAVYSNSLGNQFLSDDIAGIVQDKNMGNWFYYLRYWTINSARYFFYCIVFKLFGLNPVFFRLINIIFHLGCVWVIYALLSLLNGTPLAIMVASLFAVHPLLSEGLVWISGGLYAQYSFFVLFSFLLYYISRSKNCAKKYYWFSVIFYIPGLFTTEKAAVLFPILIFFELINNKLKEHWKKLIPYFLLTGVIVVMVVFGGQLGQRINALRTSYYQEKGFYNPLTQIPTAIANYLWLIVWPDNLTLYHSEMVYTNTQYTLMAIVTLIYFGLIVFTFLKKKYRKYCFWLGFFFISLLPMLTPLKVAWIVAERYAYLGTLGILVLIGIGLQKLGSILKNKYLLYTFFGIIIIALSIRTIVRNIDWKDQDHLWLAAARTSPSSPQNHNNLGDLYGRHGNFEKAIEEFKIAIALLPNYGDAYHNMANSYLQLGKIDEAIENYQKALTFNPGLWQSHQNLAAIYAQRGQINLTLEHLEKAVALNPQNPTLRLNLGIVYFNLGKKAEAKKEFEAVLVLDPGNQDAQKFLKSTP